MNVSRGTFEVIEDDGWLKDDGKWMMKNTINNIQI